MEKVSLYIPCYNAARFIVRCLAGVLRQTYPVDEIIIVDDGSSDKTRDIVSSYPVRVISHGKNQGLAAARNTGVLNARNGYIASLDADCEPDSRWLERLMGNFDDPAVAGIGGQLVEMFNLSLIDQWRAVHMSQNWGARRITGAEFLFGSNTVFRKDVLVKTGLYNTVYRTNNEDYEISKRLRKEGYRLIYEPEAKVSHLRQDTLHSLLNTHWKWSFFGTEGRRPPDCLYNLACRCYDRTAALFVLWREDICAGRPGLLGLDLLVYLHHIFSDIRYYLSLKLHA